MNNTLQSTDYYHSIQRINRNSRNVLRSDIVLRCSWVDRYLEDLPLEPRLHIVSDDLTR